MKEKFDPAKILEAYLPILQCKGALLAVSENGKIQTFSAGSIQESQHDAPYYIYSISKTFTAVAILRLCEDQGNFLDERFSSFFPDTEIPKVITVRQLLNHTSGLSDYFNQQDYQQAIKNDPTKPWTYKQLMTSGLKNTPLFAPNEGWAYSNPAYGLLKELIEIKSGMGYYDYLHEEIIQKSQLTHTRPFLKPDYHHSLLPGEDDNFDGDFRSLYHPEWIATGCLISTVSDIARFYDLLFDGKLISNSSVAEMKKVVDVLADPPEQNIPTYGLGIMHFKNSPQGDSYGHGGEGPGYSTYATHFENLQGNKVTISFVVNRSLGQTTFDLATSIIEHYIGTKN